MAELLDHDSPERIIRASKLRPVMSITSVKVVENCWVLTATF